MMTRLELRGGVPHWIYPDGLALPVMSGAFGFGIPKPPSLPKLPPPPEPTYTNPLAELGISDADYAAMDPEKRAMLALSLADLGDESSGGGASAFSSSEACIRLQQQFQGEQAALDRAAQTTLQTAGFDFQGASQEDQQKFQAAEGVLARAFQTQERLGEQEFTVQRDALAAQLQKDLQGLGFTHDETMLIKNQTFSAEQTALNRSFQAEEQEKSQAFQLARDEAGFKFQAGESAADRALRAQEGAADRALQAQGLQQQAADSAAQRELQARMQEAGFAQAAAERVATQVFTKEENERDREFRQALQAEGFSFQATERLATQLFSAEQQAKDRELQRELQGGQQAFQAEESAAQRALQERLQAQGFEQTTAERIASQVFTAEQGERDNVFRKLLQDEGFDHTTSERIANQTFSAEQQAKDRELQRELQGGQQTFQREQQEAQLKVERSRIFADMMGKDPVRAVLFALGAGGTLVPGGEQFQNLAPMEGAEQQAAATGKALSALTGKSVGVTTEGVQGLGGTKDVLQQARTFNRSANDAAKTVLASAFGVGSTKPGQEQAAVNTQDLVDLVKQVTPTGAFQTK